MYYSDKVSLVEEVVYILDYDANYDGGVVVVVVWMTRKNKLIIIVDIVKHILTIYIIQYNLPDHIDHIGMVFHLYELTYEFQVDAEMWKHKNTIHI